MQAGQSAKKQTARYRFLNADNGTDTVTAAMIWESEEKVLFRAPWGAPDFG